ncbi:hypothetical protein Hanom_Chr05g00457031 [Helianthus anomalus]
MGNGNKIKMEGKAMIPALYLPPTSCHTRIYSRSLRLNRELIQFLKTQKYGLQRTSVDPTLGQLWEIIPLSLSLRS